MGEINTNVRRKQIRLQLSPRHAFHFFWTSFILYACGGGGNGKSVTVDQQNDPNIVASSGKVIDGYISGARVFRDLNSNKILDPDEKYVVTNRSGEYSGLNEKSAHTLIADNNDGKAVDGATNLSFTFTMAAPATMVPSLSMMSVKPSCFHVAH